MDGFVNLFAVSCFFVWSCGVDVTASIEEPDWLRDYTTNKEEEKVSQLVSI